MKILCKRCKENKPQMAEAPLPNELGNKTYQQNCQTCWNDWVSQQLMLMNEHRLDPMNDDHSKFLDIEMIKFLGLV